MTTMETQAPQRLSLRETDRARLTELLELEPDDLPDDTGLREDLALDSLAMMRILTWLEERGVEVGAQKAGPATVGEVLTLLEKATERQISITVNQGGETVHLGPPARPSAPSADPLVPRLATKTLRLLPVLPDDVGQLYGLVTRPDTCFRWRYRGVPPAVERFAENLWAHVLVQFTVRSIQTNELVGMVMAYNADRVAMRYLYVGVVFSPQYAGTGAAAQISAVFIDYLFHTLPLHKIYLEVPGFNWPQMQSGEGKLFTVEGILHDHDSYAGQAWDQRICAIYRGTITDRTPSSS